ncbi:MAG: carboxyl-terminal processing protease [Planctomycetota bacterium]|jgi:carboxyl-terminal processing protease
MIHALLLISSLCLPATNAPAPVTVFTSMEESEYQSDMAFALDALEKKCGHFFKLKGIDWKKTRAEFTSSAKKIKTEEDQWLILTRLLARLKDGHCYVEPSNPPEGLYVEEGGPGFFLCQVGSKYFIKSTWANAEDLGLAPGMEVLSIDGVAIKKWIPRRIEEASDMRSFSTEQHALYWVLNRGFRKPEGERLKVEFKDEIGKKKKRTITLGGGMSAPNGPAVLIPGYKSLGKSIRYATTEQGNGYIHFRRTKGDEMLKELDEAMEKLGHVPGMILDFRGNSGGGCDHDALEARFIPEGKSMPRMARGPLTGAGTTTYGGPMIVIVDGTVVSAGETTSGMFKEDGRAYMIGESATAGMSSQKEFIDLPSGMYRLFVSVGTNRSTFNSGRGIEGIGVAPDETVEFEPNELAAGTDSIIRRAEDLLKKYPQTKVRYDPADYGWEE